MYIKTSLLTLVGVRDLMVTRPVLLELPAGWIGGESRGVDDCSEPTIKGTTLT